MFVTSVLFDFEHDTKSIATTITAKFLNFLNTVSFINYFEHLLRYSSIIFINPSLVLKSKFSKTSS